ncbi:hypothetical protein MOO44_02930 [Nicoliella spurrieriana]|uniref:Uncharacterized protein n=2 Tax=Nicoliella spurrieriana TaxID=2925830 RepID=A0A976X5N7_9LACO|nr:hypothetical protein MOO44_02930 [Nicoliella spurrieriana]
MIMLTIKELVKIKSKGIYFALILFAITLVFYITFKFNHDDVKSSMEKTVYKIINNPEALKRVTDKTTYKYLLSHQNVKLKNLSDNQGSGNLYYYVGQYGSGRVEYEGSIIKNKVTIKSIKYLNQS